MRGDEAIIVDVNIIHDNFFIPGACKLVVAIATSSTWGSGILLASDRVLTCAHVVQPNASECTDCGSAWWVCSFMYVYNLFQIQYLSIYLVTIRFHHILVPYWNGTRTWMQLFWN